MKYDIFNFITRGVTMTSVGRPAVILSGGFVLMSAISLIGFMWNEKKK